MLSEISASQWREWQEFAELDPFDRQRGDMQAASIVQAILNVHRDPKKRAVTLPEVMLYFGDAEMPKRPAQSLEYQEMIIDAWCSTQNAIMAQKGPQQ